jgi:hypothetical protein
MVITTAICHSRSVELSVWLSNSGVDDDTRLKYLHGFLEMVRATSEFPFYFANIHALPKEHNVRRRTRACC